MCPTKLEPKIEAIELDLSATFSYEHGFGRAALFELSSRLEAARKTVLADAHAELSEARTQPRRLLDEYKLRRRESALGRMLNAAKRLREKVDQVVIVGPLQLVEAAETLFRACCHPHHNQLSRGQRGGRPQIFFIPAVPDNDAIAAVLEILPQRRQMDDVAESWGLIAIDDRESRADGQPDELLLGIFKLFWEILQHTTTANNEAERAVAVGSPHRPVVGFANQVGISTVETFGTTINRWFHEGVLFAAAVMGVDIVKLLRGAAIVEHRFAAAPPGNNPALDFGGVCYLLAARKNVRARRIESATTSLQSLAANLQRLDGPADLLIQWVVEELRHDRIQIAMASDATMGRRLSIRRRALIDVANEQAQAIRTQRIDAAKPTVVIRLPTIHEGCVGQLIAMFQTAAAIEINLNESDSKRT
jgi:glucose-6-phosphate isomerase